MRLLSHHHLDTQQAVLDSSTPVVLMGSAGSGKSALTPKKLRQSRGGFTLHMD